MLVATIPTFYMTVLGLHRHSTIAVYLAASVASGAQFAIRGRQGFASAASKRLSTLLALGLLCCAVLPAADSGPVLVARLATEILAILRLGESYRPWFWRSGLAELMSLGVGVLGLCGLGFWWLEPRAHSFGDGVWFAFTTAATVGYGDIVPSTPASKIFAVFVVLMGVAVLSMVTAAIAAMWVQTEERKIERELELQLHRQLSEIRAELAALRRAAEH